MSKFSDRLKSLRHTRGLSQQRLADVLKTSKSSINMYERGEREPGLDMLEAIADFFNVDMDYLHGKTNIPNNGLFLATSSEEIATAHPEIKKVITKIPMFSTPVSAGTGAWLSEGHEYVFKYFEDVPKDADFALKVRGDSMDPMYFDGDIVFVRQNVIVESGQIGVFFLNGEGYMKMLQGNKLVSLNSKYSPIIINEFDSFFCAGRVVGKETAYQADIK